MREVYLIFGYLLYIAIARVCMRGLGGWLREAAFTSVNVAAFYLLMYKAHDRFFNGLFLLYILIVLVMYAAMNALAAKPGWKSWIAFFVPILFLIAARYTPTSAYIAPVTWLRGFYLDPATFSVAPYLIGISYLSFRVSYLVLEVRNGVVAKPGFWEYMGFAFFLPTMPVGPINTYSNYRRGFDPVRPELPEGHAALRILVGLVKYLFLGTIFSQLSYAGLLLDDHYHPWTDLPIAMVCYYLYLYFNFSGFCDMAIGAAGLIGIPVPENFLDPFAARNMREFWNRWHITLSQWMRDVVFSPLSRFLGRIMGAENVNHAVAITVMIVFLLLGIWHGTGWNYAVFGLLQGLGVIVTHYYTLGLKKWLGRDGFKAYNANPWILVAGRVATFCYFSATLFFFANNPKDIHDIWAALR